MIEEPMDFMIRLKKILPYLLFPPFLLPIIITPSTLFPWHFGKTIYFQWWVMLVAVLAVLVWWKFKKEGENVFGGRFVLKSLDIALIVFLFVYVVSAFFGVNPAKSLWGDIARAQGAVVWCMFGVWYFLMRVLWQEEKFFWWAGRAVAFVGVAVSLTALFQKFFQPYLGLDPSFLDSPRLSGTIGNPAFLAGYLLLASVVTVGQCMREREWLWRGLLAGSAVIMLGTMVFGTQTRSTFLGLVVWMVVVLMGLVFNNGFISKRLRLFFGMSGVVLAVVFFFVTFGVSQVAPSVSLPRFIQLQSVFNPLSQENARLWAWGVGLKAIAERPLLGWGPENFDYPFDLFYNPRFFTISFAETTWDKPHNFFIEMAVSSGLIGFFAYLIFLVFVLLFFVRNLKRSSANSTQVAWLVTGAGVLGYLVHLLFLFENSNTLLLFFFLCAFVCTASTQGTIAHFMTGRGRARVALARCGIVGLVFVFCVVGLVTYRELSVARALKSGRDALDKLEIKTWREDITGALGIKTPYRFEVLKFIVGDIVGMQKSRVLNKTIFEPIAPTLMEIFSEIDKHPAYVSYVPFYAWKGHVYEIAGEFLGQRYFIQAEESFAQGHKLSPLRQDVAYLLGKTYIFQNKFPEALALHRALYIQNPGLGEGPWFYGLALNIAGQEEKALQFLDKALFYGSRVAAEQNIEFLGGLYAQRKEYDKMITLYEDVFVKVFPENPVGYQRLAALYAQVKNKEKALENLEKAVELNPSLREEADAFIKELSK